MALEWGHGYVGTEHILYGLAVVDNSVAYNVLKQYEISPENILDKIKSVFCFNCLFFCKFRKFVNVLNCSLIIFWHLHLILLFLPVRSMKYRYLFQYLQLHSVFHH